MNEAKKLDELDIELLQAVIKQPDKSIIIDIIAPFLGRQSQQALRNRLADLEKEVCRSGQIQVLQIEFRKSNPKRTKACSQFGKMGHGEAQNSKDCGFLGR
jgi:hypothetical protein